jgi:hypothetical protein
MNPKATASGTAGQLAVQPVDDRARVSAAVRRSSHGFNATK